MDHYELMEEVLLVFLMAQGLFCSCTILCGLEIQTQGDHFYHMPLEIVFLGSLGNVLHPYPQEDSVLRQKGSKYLAILLLYPKWKVKISHWSLLVYNST